MLRQIIFTEALEAEITADKTEASPDNQFMDKIFSSMSQQTFVYLQGRQEFQILCRLT